MKKKYATYIFNIKTIYFLALLSCLLLIIKYGNLWGYDTNSYIKAWDNISSGKIDIWRTPVYPIILGISKWCFGVDKYLYVLTIIQHFVFLISIHYFHKISLFLNVSTNISLFLTAIYALFPCVAIWNCYNQTEALAIYSMIFLLYCTLKTYNNYPIFILLSYSFWLLFQTLLRPSQIYIIPTYLVFWLFIYIFQKEKSKIALLGIVSTSIVCSILIIYIYSFKKEYGILSPSGVEVLNRYYIARRDGLLNVDNTNNIHLKRFIIEKEKEFENKNGTVTDLFEEAELAINTFGLYQISEITSNCYKSSYKNTIRTFIQRIHNSSNENFMFTYNNNISAISDIIGLKLNILFYLFSFFPLYYIFIRKQKNSFSVFTFLLYTIGILQLIISLLFCQNEWGILIMPSISIYLLLFGQLSKDLQINFNKVLLQ